MKRSRVEVRRQERWATSRVCSAERRYSHAPDGPIMSLFGIATRLITADYDEPTALLALILLSCSLPVCPRAAPCYVALACSRACAPRYR